MGRDTRGMLPYRFSRCEGADQRREGSELSPAHRVVTGLLLLGLVVLGACSSASGQGEVTPTPAGTVSPTATPSPPQPAIAGVLCLDTSTSYDRGLLSRAQSALADQIDALLQPGAPGADLYVRVIKENSYSWDAELMAAIVVPAVPPEPTPPAPRPEPLPPDCVSKNPFCPWNQQKTEEEKYEVDHAAWEKAVAEDAKNFRDEMAEYQSSLESAKVSLRQQTDQLRNLNPPLAYASDLWGCLSRGAELLEDKQGEKYVILATDLDPYGLQEKPTKVSLDGVRVRVVDFHCIHAEDCEQRKGLWTQAFSEGGATDVKFYGPEESIADIWSR
jgi:hypothetical protein